MDFYGFYTGRVFDAYQFLGAHPAGEGVVFRTFAPGARAVALIADCTGWQPLPMHKVYDGNFWEVCAAGAAPGTLYKYRIQGQDGRTVDHCDPYGFSMELRPQSASIVRDLTAYRFGDGAWMKSRTDCKGGPLNIYELHAGSWRRPSDEPGDWYDYEQLAALLIPYVQRQGYNYIELLPLSEHPSDESWGYQNTGFFAPTSRYGGPEQLMAFVDACHRAGIGVLMDFVPVHFAVDDYGLARYDGTALYEYPHDAVGRSEWGSCNFMHSRGEVRSFLQSAANYWLTEYHFDGLRVDAVSNLLYWQGDPNRGENRAAVQFLQELNRGLKERHPTAILAAEDSSARPGVTKPLAEGGLGFDYKWDMGWMHDTLEYFQTGPEYRPRDYHKLTFSMQYFYNERYLLPLSHDEVVHGKAAVAQKMHGGYEEKFPQARALYLYMYAHPGKKLNFMGAEFAQLREWDEARQQDWLLLEYPVHDAFRQFMADLGQLYLKTAALWRWDDDPAGFCWRECQAPESCVYAFERRNETERVLAVFNFSDAPQTAALALPGAAGLRLLLAADDERYGGPQRYEGGALALTEEAVELPLGPYAARLYEIVEDTAEE